VFMARANAAYYASRDPFADFTTAPEISQMFGELLGLWAAVTWQAMGAPDPVVFAEAGPGRGTLMADALRAIGQTTPNFGRAMRLHLVEASPRLRAIQAERLPAATWHDRIDELPPGPLLLLGNEFLDALPIRQLVRRGDGWTERYVAHGTLVEHPLSPTGGEGSKSVMEACSKLAKPPAPSCPTWPAGSRPMAGPRCSSTTARNTARPATACKRCETASRPTRLASRAAPT